MYVCTYVHMYILHTYLVRGRHELCMCVLHSMCELRFIFAGSADVHVCVRNVHYVATLSHCVLLN